MTHRTRQQSYRDQLLCSALAYAEAGWPVFPLRPGTKRPAVPNHTEATCDGSDRRCADRHIGWEPRATLDPDRIEAAWRHRPYGIGIACGPAGLVVVDLDISKRGAPSGAETLAQLEHEHGQALPATWTTGTPSGGRHFYYLHPSTGRLGNTTGRVGPGIDTRAHGGYVVAPPTQTTDNNNTGGYWVIDDHVPVELPAWFAALLTPTRPEPANQPPRRWVQPVDGDRTRRYVQAAVAGEVDRINSAPEGHRNRTLYIASAYLGELIGAGLLDYHHAEQTLLAATPPWYGIPPQDPFTEHEARQTITSGLRRGASKPRQLPTALTTFGATR